MDTLLADYKLYYKARMDRYDGDPQFAYSYQSEKALLEAMDSCQELIEFKDKIGDLNIKNAIGLVKDQETARLSHYTALQENVRALAPTWILEKIDTAADANDVVTISMEMDQKASIAITVDGFMDVVWSDLIPSLESLEVMEKAEIPSQYEQNRQSQVQDIKTQIKSTIADLRNQARDWDAAWQLNLELVWEFRHRKKIPLTDEVLQKRINELKNYL
ncbi:MAG: hypothetical protein GQ574_09850 [Crocinitomix sp.]|nr:hypothetical protein [Crocinitomix sp.]